MQDDMRHRQELIEIKRRSLRHLEKKAAQYGPLEVPLHLLGEIEVIKEEIIKLEQERDGTQLQLKRPVVGKSRTRPVVIIAALIVLVAVLVYTLGTVRGGTMLDMWNAVLAVIAGIALGVLGNYIYDLLRTHGWLPERPSVKRALLIILFFVPFLCVALLPHLGVGSEISSDSNDDPVIQNISVNPEIIEIGQKATITVDAIDPDGDSLTYVWTVSNGNIVEGPSQQSTVNYEAPDIPGDVVLRVIVRDGKGGEAERRRNISIVMPSSTP
jgi:hypothetical protein